MRSKQIITWVVVLLAVAVAGNYAYRRYSAKPQAAVAPINTDDYLQTEVQRKLDSSGVFQNDKIAVSAHDGTVTLTGIVYADWRRISAGNIASSTPAVLEVKNLIKVREQAPEQPKTWATSGDAPSAPRKPRPKGFGMDANDPQTKAAELTAQGNDYLAHKNYNAAIRSFRAALALDASNYAAQSGLQEAQRMR